MVQVENGKEKGQDFKKRIYLFAALPSVFFAVIIVVLVFLQIISGPVYELKARNNREQFSILPAIRGIIVDRTGKVVLANNQRSFAVSVVPSNLPEQQNKKEELLERLAILLEMEKEEIIANIQEKSYSINGSHVIKTDVQFSDVVFLAEHDRSFPGVYWKSKPKRFYPLEDSLCHVIGYMGMINQKQYLELAERGYNTESVIGKNGVEKAYDIELRGKDGYIKRIVDATSKVEAEIIDEADEPAPGNNVMLTIDTRIQRLAENALGDSTGAVIVSRPATGEILAMVSSPRFDPNLFVSQGSPHYYNKLALDKNKPFLNRAIQAHYPAGSIFKLVVALGLLNEDKISPDKKFRCGGGYQLGNKYFSCWSRHGRVDLYQAIVESCDSYFYQASLVLGAEKMGEYARMMGLGKKLGIDLDGEIGGCVPGPGWKLKNMGEIWYEGDTLNMAIGQGYILVTPLQINALTNLIANRGVLMRPFVVKEIRHPETGELVHKKSPEIIVDSMIDRSHFDFVAGAMRGVVTHGTAKWGGAVLSVDMAGKTSSAEVSGKQTHSWFTAFAPYGHSSNEKKVSVTAIVEHGGAGSAVAAPIVSQIVEGIFAECDLETARKNIWKKKVQIYRKEKEENQQEEMVE